MNEHAQHAGRKLPDLKIPDLPEALLRGPIRTIDTHPLSGFNKAVAVWITDKVGTMWCAYIFGALALVSLPAAILSGSALVIVAWIAQTFLQLVLLPVIIVGQNVQAAHADARAETDHELAQTSHEMLTVLNTINQQQLQILNQLKQQEPAS